MIIAPIFSRAAEDKTPGFYPSLAAQENRYDPGKLCHQAFPSICPDFPSSQEIRRKDGNPYPAHTLMQIVMGIQRYLRQQAGKPSICILDRNNRTYAHFRRTLDARIKALQGESASANGNGVGGAAKNVRKPASNASNNNNNQVEAILRNKSASPPIRDYLYKTVDLSNGGGGVDSAQHILNAVCYHNLTTFNIVSVDDHWSLQVGDKTMP